MRLLTTVVQRTGDRVSIAVGGRTTVDVVLCKPRTAELRKGKPEVVREIRFAADAPDDLVALARTGLEAGQPTG